MGQQMYRTSVLMGALGAGITGDGAIWNETKAMMNEAVSAQTAGYSVPAPWVGFETRCLHHPNISAHDRNEIAAMVRRVIR
mgnify:CR=1 FL=1